MLTLFSNTMNIFKHLTLNAALLHFVCVFCFEVSKFRLPPLILKELNVIYLFYKLML